MNIPGLPDLIARALEEDIGPGDITSEWLIPESTRAEMRFVARQPLVACGVFVPQLVFQRLSSSPESRSDSRAIQGRRDQRRKKYHAAPTALKLDSPRILLTQNPGNDEVQVKTPVEEGAFVDKGTVLLTATGPARALLAGERVALNFMQRLSGVATLTRRYVEAVKGTKAVILDTRKTMPGMRSLDKYAVRLGGGQNHRMGLYDAVLIKDNHIEIGIRDWGLGIGELISQARKKIASLSPNPQSLIPIIVECDILAQVEEALAAKPDRILLDNMSLADMRKAVAMAAGKIPLEASGNVSLDNVRAIAETGVDYISVGKLTHSAPAADIGADIIYAKTR